MRGPRAIHIVCAVFLLMPLLLAGPATAVRSADPGFRHPGVLLSRAQLDAVRGHVKSGREPWAAAYRAMRASAYASAGYRAHPRRVVVCPWDGRPSDGCVDERKDALAAYTQALLWYITRDRRYAANAIRVMDAWSGIVKDHTEGNAGLQAAWAGSSWARAAEIVRWTKGGWPKRSVRRFAHMLREVYLPEVGGAPDFNGNWDLAMADAATGIAVFLDDRAAFDEALGRLRARVRAYFHLGDDGPLPPAPEGSAIRTPEQITAYWFGQTEFPDGIAQETCRNFEHVGYALAATAHIAETALHQGVDLYDEIEERLAAALEFHARYELGEPVPQWLCGGQVRLGLGPVTEVAVNHLEHRLETELPRARRLTERQRPAGTDDLFVAWETLTHADNPGTGEERERSTALAGTVHY